ncbi:MAG: hypothetical protein RIC03_18750 [Cyclobacteriaceae bacterium]
MRYVFVFLLSFSTLLSNAQQTPTTKILVHLDKPYYLAGEKIYFSIHTWPKSNESQILYLQISDPQGKLVKIRRILAEDNLGYGVINLPDDMPSNEYLLAVFTPQALRLNNSVMFQQKLHILNINDPFLRNSMSKDFQLYPEGGQLVSDHVNNIAFQAQDQLIGKRFFVTTKDGKDTVLNKVISCQFDQFLFEHQQGENYELHYFKNGSINTIPFLKADQKNVSLLVKNNSNEFLITPKVGDQFKQDTLNFVIENNNQIVLAAKLRIGVIVNIPKNQLPTGESMLYVKDKDHQVLAKRLLYNNTTDHFKSLELNQKRDYPRRSKVSLAAENSYHSEQKVSLSILNETYFGSQYCAKNLSPESKYFNAALITRSQNADYVKVNNSGYVAKENKSMINIIGSIRDKKTNLPLDTTTVYLYYGSSRPRLDLTKTNENGIFFFEIPSFDQDQAIKLSASSDLMDAEITYELFPPALNFESYEPSLSITQGMLDYIEAYKANRVIEQIYQTQDNKTTKAKSKYIGIAPEPTKTLDLDEYISLESFEEIVKELLAGVKVKKSKVTQIYLHELDWTKQNLMGLMDLKPLHIIDGFVINDSQKMLDIPAESIKMIFVKNEKYYIKDQTFGGVIEVITKDRAFALKHLETNIETVIDGMALKETKLTSVLRSQSPLDKLPDLRNVLHWNPTQKLSQTIDFSTADYTGKYRVELKGIDNSGNEIYQKSTLHIIK